MNTEISKIREETVQNYSKRNVSHYDDPMNKNFVYGEMTIDFVNKIEFKDNDKVIADIGCGTGFVYDIIYDKLKNQERKLIGIEPARGMLELAKKKYNFDKNIAFFEGTFACMPLENESVDKIISTLAMHWVPSIDDSLKELKRVLKPNGSVDIMMTEKDDGDNFKNPIVKAMKRHLSFKQIMNAATLSQRVSSNHIVKHFSKYFDLKRDYELSVKTVKKIINGTFNEHMKWWKARSEQIISEIKDKDNFLIDLKNELDKTKKPEGIPFDLSILHIHLKGLK